MRCSAAVSSSLATTRSANGMPRCCSSSRPLSQGGQSALVYRVTGKRAATLRNSSGKGVWLGAP